MKNRERAHFIMSSMVWLMICLTLSVSSSAIPCSPMLNDASLVLPSYLHSTIFELTCAFFPAQYANKPSAIKCVIKTMYEPNHRGEVTSYFGFDESFIERRVWSRDHQGRQQAESESFKCISDAKKKAIILYINRYFQFLSKIKTYIKQLKTEASLHLKRYKTNVCVKQDRA